MTNEIKILDKFFGKTIQGKKCFFSEEQKQEMRQLKNKGVSNKELMQKYNIPQTSLLRYLDPQGVEKARQARLANPQWSKKSNNKRKEKYRSRTKEQRRQDVKKQYERTGDKERRHLRTLYGRMKERLKLLKDTIMQCITYIKKCPLFLLKIF